MSSRDHDAFRRGDGVFFHSLVERLTPRVLHIASSYADGYKEAHDLAQEVWIRVWEKRRSFAGESSVTSWVFGVARNVCMEYARNEKNRTELRAERVEQIVDSAHGTPGPGPETQARQKELNRIVLEATGELSPREFEVMSRRVFGQERLTDIATDLECAEGTVRSLLHRALTKVRQSMDRSLLT